MVRYNQFGDNFHEKLLYSSKTKPEIKKGRTSLLQPSLEVYEALFKTHCSSTIYDLLKRSLSVDKICTLTR